MPGIGFIEAEIVERVDYTDELWVIRARPERPVEFKPGQFATFAREIDGRIIQRAYSIVSSPYEPDLEFFIELVPGGRLTPALHELKVGDRLTMRDRLTGSFTLDQRLGAARHLFLATVTGVAPFVSMLRTHRADLGRGAAPELRFALLHGASRARELVYREELEALACDGWLTYVPTVSRPWDDPEWGGETGRVDDLIRKYADHLGYDATSCVAYACGHPLMIDNAKAILKRARFPRERLRDEKFFKLS